MADAANSRPRYVQIREALIERIRSGGWKPGQLIPNEFEVASEFGVSQGTARKAIDALAADGLVERQQGRGTFVVEETPARVLFRFFHLYDAQGAQLIPDSPAARPLVAPADADQRRALALPERAQVIVIERVRTAGGRPFSIETIVLPEAMFPQLGRMANVPNTLYDLFQKSHGVLVARADDRISAVVASADQARRLGIAAGAPLLRIDRIAYSLDDKPLEWRVSLCHLAGAHYLARLK
jgi:GntR family transcriptional regulator